jgi:hypothetical protein
MATVTLSSGTTGGVEYKGKLTVITEGVPAAGGNPVPGRGWLVGGFVIADDAVRLPMTTSCWPTSRYSFRQTRNRLI